MLLFCIRHGETVENATKRIQGQSPGSLSSNGILNTIKMASRIKSLESINQIFSSDLKRATDTSLLIMNGLGLSGFSTDSRLRERGFGVLEGCSIFALKRLLVEQACNLKKVEIEGAESHSDFVARIKESIQELIALPDSNNKLVVTHAGVLQVIWENFIDFETQQPVFRNNSGFILRLTADSMVLHNLLV